MRETGCDNVFFSILFLLLIIMMIKFVVISMNSGQGLPRVSDERAKIHMLIR